MLRAEAAAHKADDVIAIARRLGMTVESEDSITLDGAPYRRLAIVCRTNTEALRLLNALAHLDASPEHGEKVHALSKRLWTEASGDADAFARRAHAIIRDAVAYVDDPEQTFRSSDVTLTLGFGNCVNTARVLCALALAAGLDAHAMPVRPHGEITHTAAQIRYAGAWHWAEATIAANYDEEPLTAARRLGILRPDVASAAPCCATCAPKFPFLVPSLRALVP